MFVFLVFVAVFSFVLCFGFWFVFLVLVCVDRDLSSTGFEEDVVLELLKSFMGSDLAYRRKRVRKSKRKRRMFCVCVCVLFLVFDNCYDNVLFLCLRLAFGFEFL